MTNNQDKLFRSIDKITTDLVHTGKISEWNFKDYLFCIMFYRYISENLVEYMRSKNVAYPSLSDQEAESYRHILIQEKGFFILPSELFNSMHQVASEDEHLNQTLETVFCHIEASSETRNSFRGLFDNFKVSNTALGESIATRNKILVKLLDGVAKMPLFSTDGAKNDLFGDTYEYLMYLYASREGEKGGQYFTPADVSELVAHLGTINKLVLRNVYDPACGSGSLLLKVAKVIGKENITNGFYGQEIDSTVYNLGRINMFLHNIDKFNIAHEDTLINPQHRDIKFELIVSNPPFSIPWSGNEISGLIQDSRFSPAGVLAPSSKGDMAFIMHSLYSLSDNGVAVMVCYPGIMYRQGAEQKIRKYLVDNNYIDTIIQLPSNLFLNVTLAVDILILNKNKRDNHILFVDASKEFIKVRKNNRLTPKNIQNIVSMVVERKSQPHIAQLILNREVEHKSYNLSVSTYVEAEDSREKINIKQLNAEIDRIVARESILRDEIAKIIASIDV